MRTHFLVFAPLWSSMALAAWTPLGPFGGPAAVVQADRFQVGTFLAATSEGCIYRTKNGGQSWSQVPFPGQFRGTLHALLVDDRVPFVYLVGMSSEDPEYAG